MAAPQENIDLALKLTGTTLRITGPLTVYTSGDFLRLTEKALEGYAEPQLVFDLEGLSELDSSGATTLHHLLDALALKSIRSEISGASKEAREKLDLFRPSEEPVLPGVARSGLFGRLGSETSTLWNDYILSFLQLASDIFYWSVAGPFRKRAHRKGEVINQAVQIGVNAVLIVAVMSFIIGLVLALQSAAQLRTFGANIYIVDLTVIAMMSEMGPLITAIMVAGRSGSSIAAEIATMKTTSETDALRIMGMPPIRFVVVPKMYGGLLTMPFLTIIADVAGILGGMLIGLAMLDISPGVFINRMQEILLLRDIIFGVIKSLFFIYLIVVTGTFFGFRARGGAPGVGRVTTRAVVVSISLVIVADSIMGLIFY